MTFSKYTGAAAKLMYYILWFCFLKDFSLFLHLTGKKIKKRVRNYSSGVIFNIQNVPGVSSWLAFFFLTGLPPDPQDTIRSVKLENRKQKPSTVVNHAIKIDYL